MAPFPRLPNKQPKLLRSGRIPPNRDPTSRIRQSRHCNSLISSISPLHPIPIPTPNPPILPTEPAPHNPSSIHAGPTTPTYGPSRLDMQDLIERQATWDDAQKGWHPLRRFASLGKGITGGLKKTLSKGKGKEQGGFVGGGDGALPRRMGSERRNGSGGGTRPGFPSRKWYSIGGGGRERGVKRWEVGREGEVRRDLTG
ncbi:hypothetical protein GQ44DRAFT_768959 [Phaeosphaeriaceae sp. PMI808]|nr:hypothetical protein GQ44DRAFT_768959 [Phaeosphaeriaceae sp. PMI808]